MQDMEKSSSIMTKDSMALYNNEIKLLDSDPDNNLTLYSYIRCNDESNDKSNDKSKDTKNKEMCFII